MSKIRKIVIKDIRPQPKPLELMPKKLITSLKHAKITVDLPKTENSQDRKRKDFWEL